MQNLKNTIIYFCLFLFPYLIFGQYLSSRNYSTKDGLPNNAVRSLFLDSENVLWIGTENGVSRKENGSFFNIDESDGLGHNSCWDITQDQDGNMWFASYGGGVSKFDGKKFTVFTTKNGLPLDRVRKIFAYKNEIFVGTELGVSIIDIKTNKVITPKGILPHSGVFLVSGFFTYKEDVYFSTINEGLFKIDKFTSIAKIIPVLNYQNVYALGFFGTTLYGSNKGFVDEFNFNESTNTDFASSKYGKSIVWQYAKGKKNILYAAAWGVFSPDGGLYSISNKEMKNVSDYYGIDSKNLLNVVYDKSKDILYVGSKDKGIYEVRLDKMIDYNRFNDKAIIDFDDFFGKRIILNQDGVTLLNAKNECYRKISLFDFKKKEIDFVNKNKKRLPKHEDGFYELNYAIPASEIEFYEVVKHNKLMWISSNIGIFAINTLGKIIDYLPLHTYKFGFTKDNKFIETIPYAGVHVYNDVHSLKSKHYSEFEKNTPLDIVKILNYNDKTYLVSVFNGIYTYHNNQFKSYLADGIWKENKFKHITLNDKGQLILAAEFGNVFIVEDTKSFKVLKTISKNKLVGKTILFLEAYKDCILIGTEKGINIYQNGVFRLIDQEQGLKDCNFTTSQIFNNQLWLGTKNGFYTVDLDKLLKEQITVSGVDITKIAVNNIPVDKSNYKWFKYASSKLVCDYQHNSFSIDFIPKGHPFPEKLKFRYRLKSKNRWSPYSDKANLFLPYLPFGDYVVEVEVFDSNAGKSSVFKLLDICVEPPFWFTWWFISLIVLFISVLVFYIINRKKNTARDKASKEKQITEAKFEALSNQMNPHFIYNALNSIQDYVGANDEHNSTLYISEFAGLMRKTLKNSPKQTITIEDEVEYLESYIYIENMRFKDRVVSEIYIHPSIDDIAVEIPPMLIQPFVENVFVHAFDESHPSPKLKISFEMVNDKVLECKIIDNGKGLNAHKQSKFHVSRGIALARERIILLQPSNVDPIHIQFTENDGTTVTIRLFF